jgi:hypothetical protein
MINQDVRCRSAPVLFVAANLVVGLIATASLWLIVCGKLGNNT